MEDSLVWENPTHLVTRSSVWVQKTRVYPRTQIFFWKVPLRNLRRSWKRLTTGARWDPVGERLWGLTDTFLERVWSPARATFNLSLFIGQKMYRFSNTALQIGPTSFMTLVLPVTFEPERSQMEPRQQLQSQQILLGPKLAVRRNGKI